MVAHKNKLLIKFIASFMLFCILCAQFTASTYAKVLDDDVDWNSNTAPAIELKVIEIKDETDGTEDKQVIALLRAYNMEFATLELNLTYDKNIIEPSELDTNVVIGETGYQTNTTHYSLNAADIDAGEEDYNENVEFWWTKYLPNWLQYVISIFIPETGGNSNVYDGDYHSSIIAGTEGITLCKLSYRLKAGETINKNTFQLEPTEELATGIKVVSSIIENEEDGELEYNEYYDKRLFRVVLLGNNNLLDIQINGDSIEEFAPDVLEYEIDLYIDEETVSILPIPEDDKSSITVKYKTKNPENEDIYEEIEIDDIDGDYKVPLSGLRRRNTDTNYYNTGIW